MIPKPLAIFLTILGLLLALGSIAAVADLDRPLAFPESVSFTDTNGDRLVGTHFSGRLGWGVLLLEGFGSDQVTMTSLASEFSGGGWHIFSFDFSGHGRSPGTLAFDNARTDRLAGQALAALKEFQRVSGLLPEQILVVGHSLGARVALQAATMNPERTMGLVLLGTQVNLSTNVQSEFFTGTSDTDLPWVQALGPQNPPVPVLLVSGEWDDILTPAGAGLLFSKLTASRYVLQGNWYRSDVAQTAVTSTREQFIEPTLVHNYEPFSARVMARIDEWLRSRLNSWLAGSRGPETRVWAWIIGFTGMVLALAGAEKWVKAGQAGESERPEAQVANLRRFLWGKLLLWLGALPVAAGLGSIFFFIPLGKPVLNLIYVGFIGGYGLLLSVLYGRGKMPGVQGRLWPGGSLPFRFRQEVARLARDWKRLGVVLVITAGALLLTAAYARTGWFYVFPINLRLVWLLIFTPFTAVGFWIGLKEAQMLPGWRGAQEVLTLIGLLPFFLYTILMAVLGSLSGMIGGLQGLLILWLVLVFGSLIQAVGRRQWLAALCMAVLLYWLILPQGVLFG